MSAIVDFNFYYNVYLGQDADQASFPALCARAEDVIGAMTRWAVTPENIDRLPTLAQTLYKKAICAQIDFLSVNGLDSISESAGGRGWTVGKVSVTAGQASTALKGRLSESIAPLAISFLEQTGLMNPQVPTGPDMPLIGWWL